MRLQRLLKILEKNLTNLYLKGAFIEEAIYLGDDQLDKLVAIKSKDELIGEIITLLQFTSQKRNFITSNQEVVN